MFCNTTRRQALQLAAMPTLLCLSLAAGAEGAVRIFDCKVIRQCDAAALCAETSGQVAFRMEPVTLDASGAGSYRLSHGSRNELSMQALSDIGPFVWSDSAAAADGAVTDQRNTLVISSETQLLWHTLSLAVPPSAVVRYMDCKLQQ